MHAAAGRVMRLELVVVVVVVVMVVFREGCRSSLWADRSQAASAASADAAS